MRVCIRIQIAITENVWRGAKSVLAWPWLLADQAPCWGADLAAQRPLPHDSDRSSQTPCARLPLSSWKKVRVPFAARELVMAPFAPKERTLHTGKGWATTGPLRSRS